MKSLPHNLLAATACCILVWFASPTWAQSADDLNFDDLEVETTSSTPAPTNIGDAPTITVDASI